MIKVELTKNVFNQRGGGLFGLKPIQIVFAVIAMAVGGVTVLWLMHRFCCYRYGCRRCDGAVAYAVRSVD